MSNDPILRAAMQELDDAVRELREGIEKRQKQADIVAVGLSAVAILVISYLLETFM